MTGCGYLQICKEKNTFSVKREKTWLARTHPTLIRVSAAANWLWGWANPLDEDEKAYHKSYVAERNASLPSVQTYSVITSWIIRVCSAMANIMRTCVWSVQTNIELRCLWVRLMLPRFFWVGLKIRKKSHIAKYLFKFPFNNVEWFTWFSATSVIKCLPHVFLPILDMTWRAILYPISESLCNVCDIFVLPPAQMTLHIAYGHSKGNFFKCAVQRRFWRCARRDVLSNFPIGAHSWNRG